MCIVQVLTERRDLIDHRRKRDSAMDGLREYCQGVSKHGCMIDKLPVEQTLEQSLGERDC